MEKRKREAENILYVPISSESCVKRKRGFREVNSQPEAEEERPFFKVFFRGMGVPLPKEGKTGKE